ncbi:hypothetical protein ZWY2020_046471 [Hordeum vulgare]|nr:hypothetical protein ZWY2020_046471 [Hordeum vulgare]
MPASSPPRRHRSNTSRPILQQLAPLRSNLPRPASQRQRGQPQVTLRSTSSTSRRPRASSSRRSSAVRARGAVLLQRFEQQYDGCHLFFYGCRLSEVLAFARREGNHVFLYLHDPGHSYTELFCRGTLCSNVVVEFLDANFISWGAVTSRGEGPTWPRRCSPAASPSVPSPPRSPAKASQSYNVSWEEEAEDG